MEMLRTQSESINAGPEIMSIGELHRCILAKLTVKEVRRAINKYRDLMPKESDWNRKLSQSSKKPELGFRYLFRCGQIDDDNNRTLQKMLKYMDRYDILPYFQTLRYQDACQTASDHPACEDPVESFLCREVGNGENVLTSAVYRMERKRASSSQQSDGTGCLTRAKCRRISSQLEAQPRVHSVAPPGAGIQMSTATASQSPASSLASASSTASTSTAATSSTAAAGALGQPPSSGGQAFCDLRMRVRAEYQQIHRLLSNQLHSHRNDPAQRQFDLFFQASNTLNSHDLGDILCDIRFSDLHYLEAFWRDYVSGELAHAIKSVFVRHYLMDRFNPADVQVHISLDAADYYNGRQVLLRSYAEHYSRLAKVRESQREMQEQQLMEQQLTAPQEADAAASAAATSAATAPVATSAATASKPSKQRTASAVGQRSRRLGGSSGGGSGNSGVPKRLTRRVGPGRAADNRQDETMRDAPLPTTPAGNPNATSWLLPSVSASPLPDPCEAAAGNATAANASSAACRDRLGQPMAASASGLGRRKKLRASSLASSLSGDAITMQQVAGRSTESLEDPAHYDQDWFLHSLENALFSGRSCSSDSSLAVVAASVGPTQPGGHLAPAAASRLHARGLQASAAVWARA
uniref:RGS domain-containing protein n=1 Tax=Macrostomum lignano TaxID=282301 RepID=A0A1I8JLR5_9PLAT